MARWTLVLAPSLVFGMGLYSGLHSLNTAEEALPTTIELGKGWPSNIRAVLEDMQVAAQDLPESALQYAFDHLGGTTTARNATASFLSWAHARQTQSSTPVRAEELLLTYGTQGALAAICNAYFTDGDTVVLEELSYFNAFSTCNVAINFVSAPLDANGMISIEGLNQTIRSQQEAGAVVRAFYTVPTFHNPTQAVYPGSLRKQLVQLAMSLDFLIIADEESELITWPGTTQMPLSMHFYDRDEDSMGGMGHVISTMSTSKFYSSPGLSVGWILARPARIANMSVTYSSTAGSPITQALWANAIHAGRVASTYQDIMQDYQHRATSLRGALKLPLGSNVKGGTIGGTFLWVCLPRQYNVTLAFGQSAEVVAQYGVTVYLPRKFEQQGQSAHAYDHCMRLCYIYLDVPELIAGAARLSNLIARNASLFGVD